MEKRPAGKRLLRETDYALLKRVLCGASSLICLDVDDLTVLQKGGAAFLLESPPCASMDELIRLAPLAAAEMAPERGRKIVSAVLYVNVPGDMRLENLDGLCRAIQRPVPKDADIRFGCGYNGKAGFLLATSEGSTEKRGKTR
jgi:hypothetical protein